MKEPPQQVADRIRKLLIQMFCVAGTQEPPSQ